MGPLNSVSDGVVFLYVFYGIMTIFGNDMYKHVVIESYGMRVVDFINLIISASQVFAIITK